MMSLRRMCALLFVAGLAGMSASAQAPDLEKMDIILKSVPDGPVARVKGAAIPRDAFVDLYRGEVIRFAQVNPGAPVTEKVRIGIAYSTLRLLIQREVLYQAAAQKGLEVSEEELDEAWKQEMDHLRKMVTKEGDEPPTDDQLLQEAGATREEGLTELRRSLLIEKMRQAIIDENEIAVSDEEIAAWHAENRRQLRRPDVCHLQQVFIRLPRGRLLTPETKQEARKRAEAALRRLRSGQSFEKVAKEVSDHPASIKDEGGDIGTGPVASLPEPLQEAVSSLKPGDVSGIVETTAGFYITKLVEFIPGEELDLEKSKDRIQGYLLAQKRKDAVLDFCAENTNPDEDIQVFLDLEKQLIAKPELLELFKRAMSGNLPELENTAESGDASP